MKGIYLLLGSNLGDREEQLQLALRLIRTCVGSIVRKSSIYQTKAWGIHEQPDFLNLVVEIQSELEPVEILDEIVIIEKALGRKRIEKWGSRSIDIDILYYSDIIINTQRLTIPHPRISERKFTLIPLCEIAPEWIHPGLQKNHKTLAAECEDGLVVKKWIGLNKEI